MAIVRFGKMASGAVTGVLGLALALAAGCSDESQPAADKPASAAAPAPAAQAPAPAADAAKGGEAAKTVPSDITTYPDTAVLFRLNGEDYTKRDFDREMAMQFALARVRRPSLKESKLPEIKRRRGSEMIRNAFGKMVVRQRAAKAGAVADEAVYAEKCERFTARFRKSRRNEKLTFEGLCQRISADGSDALLRRNLRDDATVAKYFRQVYTNEAVVTDANVAKLQQLLVEAEEFVATTNAIIYATMSNIVREVRAGADFARLSDRYDEYPGREAGGAMGECDKNDFAIDPDTWAALRDLKGGAVSEPLDTIEGLAVFRVNRRIERHEDTNELTLDLSRIVMHRAVARGRMTAEEARAQLEGEVWEELSRREMLAAMKSAKFELPSGMEFADRNLRRQWKRIIDGPAPVGPLRQR